MFFSYFAEFITPPPQAFVRPRASKVFEIDKPPRGCWKNYGIIIIIVVVVVIIIIMMMIIITIIIS